MSSYLVVLDNPGIKEYVFSTSPLVQIRGASSLLDRLNRADTETFLKSLFKDDLECVFSGGGTAHFIIRAPRDRVIDALEKLKGYYFKKSGGGIRLLYGLGNFGNYDYRAALAEAFAELKHSKTTSPRNPPPLLHTGFVRECDTCSALATELISYGERNFVLCEICGIKVRNGLKRGYWQELAKFFPEIENLDQFRPRDFAEIGERCRSAPGYTALVYADGNAMGKIIKQLNSLEDFRFFSKMVDTAVRDACYETIKNLCPPDNGKIPADILLLGGDDLLVYITADKALPFAIRAARLFNEKTTVALAENASVKNLLGESGITISLGIAFGKSHTPFGIMLDQAEELLHSAKKAGAKDIGTDTGNVPTYIDYHLTSYFNQINVADCREVHLTMPGGISPTRLFQKPYSLEGLERLWEHAEQWVSAGIPQNRLKRFGTAPSLGKFKGSLDFLKAYVRTEEHHRKLVDKTLEFFGCAGPHIPWRTEEQYYSTMLVDLIELTEFITIPQQAPGAEHVQY